MIIDSHAHIFPFLGSYLLAEPIDTFGADLVLHGHAHSGSEHGARADRSGRGGAPTLRSHAGHATLFRRRRSLFS